MDDVVDVHGFTVVPTRTTAQASSGHYFFLKKESPKVLLVLNVPPYVNEKCLGRVFRCCGKVVRARIESSKSDLQSMKPVLLSKYFDRGTTNTSDFKIGRVTFKMDATVQKALEIPFSMPLVLSTDEHPIVTGVEKWLLEYKEENTCDTSEVQKHIDEYMGLYDKKVEEDLEAEKRAAETPDEDGWVLVTRTGKNKGIPRNQAVETSITQKHDIKQKDKELLHFYAFQKTNAKKERIAELRQKFEEDKHRINQMKAQRKFRPY